VAKTNTSNNYAQSQTHQNMISFSFQHLDTDISNTSNQFFLTLQEANIVSNSLNGTDQPIAYQTFMKLYQANMPNTFTQLNSIGSALTRQLEGNSLGLVTSNSETVLLSFNRGSDMVDTRTMSYKNSVTSVSFGYTSYTPSVQMTTTVPITRVTNLQRLSQKHQPCTPIDSNVEQLPFGYYGDKCWALCFDQAYFQSVYNCSLLALEKELRTSNLPLCPTDNSVQIDMALAQAKYEFLLANPGQTYQQPSAPDTVMQNCMVSSGCNSALACDEWDFQVDTNNIQTVPTVVNTKPPLDLRLVHDWISEMKSWGNWVHTVNVIPGEIEVISEFQINTFVNLLSNIGGIVGALTNLHCILILNFVIYGIRRFSR